MAYKSKTIVSNFLWRFFERVGAQGVTFVVSIILARLLDPDVYGTVALITVITSILQVFLDGGFSTALIQKKDADDLDFSSVFYFNVVFGLILYLLLFFASPWIAKFYHMPELTPVIRVLGLTLIIFSLKSVQQAYVSRHMLFKKFFFATLGGDNRGRRYWHCTCIFRLRRLGNSCATSVQYAGRYHYPLDYGEMAAEKGFLFFEAEIFAVFWMENACFQPAG